MALCAAGLVAAFNCYCCKERTLSRGMVILPNVFVLLTCVSDSSVLKSIVFITVSLNVHVDGTAFLQLIPTVTCYWAVELVINYHLLTCLTLLGRLFFVYQHVHYCEKDIGLASYVVNIT